MKQLPRCSFPYGQESFYSHACVQALLPQLLTTHEHRLFLTVVTGGQSLKTFPRSVPLKHTDLMQTAASGRTED